MLQLKALIDEGVAALSQRDFILAIEKFEAALAQAPVHAPAIDVATHNVLTARKQYMEHLLENEATEQTQPHLQRAFELSLRGPLAQDAGFRRAFANAYYDLNKAFYRARA
ncbi:MAG: hypothetical protein R3F10_10345, partial [Lysobacteraceae bacterium]